LRNLTVNVEVASKTFDIWGEVKIAGVKNLLVQTTVLKAVASAGGFTDYAKVTGVIVLRTEKGNTVSHVVDCKDILSGKAPDVFVIRPNDIVYVPRKTLF
jgi:polysaccharide export outer membrane protein